MRFIDVFIALAVAMSRQASRRVETHGLRAGIGQLFNRSRGAPGLADDAVAAHGHLIRPQDPCIGVLDGYGSSFRPRQSHGEPARCLARPRRFIDLRRSNLERDAEARQEVFSITRTGGQNQGRWHVFTAVKTIICGRKTFDTWGCRHYDTAPMSRDPAEQLDVAALAAHSSQLEFESELKALTRVAPLLRETRGSVRGRFRFHNETGFPGADGRITATLALTCQRCLDEVVVPVDAECRLVFADVELKDEDVPAGYELATTQAGRISFAELVEDELLLALPLVAAHGEGSGCVPQPAAESKSRKDPTQRPFAGLRELMKDRY